MINDWFRATNDGFIIPAVGILFGLLSLFFIDYNVKYFGLGMSARNVHLLIVTVWIMMCGFSMTLDYYLLGRRTA